MELKIIVGPLSLVFLLFIAVAIPGPIKFDEKIDDIDKKVTFWLYSRNNQDKPKQMFVGQDSTYQTSNYSTGRETVFVTHGWKSSNKSDACLSVKNGFLYHADYNVIVVDWSKIAGNGPYGPAVRAVRAVGEYVSQQINYLVKQGTNPDNIHLVGHSLGSHVMGLAGYLANDKVAHVVGLDPAGPRFGDETSNGRISTDSGKYVEVIHTCEGKLGMKPAIGHVDYYPNGGGSMPGCTNDIGGNCSHGRAYYYYEESLKNPERWYARLCPSWSNFSSGICVDENIVPFARWTARGIERDLNQTYYFRTNKEKPYGLGIAGTNP